MKRHLLLTPALQKSLCKLLADGVPTKTAAEACGISDRTVRSWLSQAEEVGADSALVAFASAVSRARAKARVELLRRITEAARVDWRAAAFVLAKLDPQVFGRAAEEAASFASASHVTFSHSYMPDTNGAHD